MTPLLLLHGALGSAAQFDALRPLLPADRPVYALNFPGHGGVRAGGPFSMDYFSSAVLHFLDENNHPQADIFGYSMGGYVALYTAWKHPGRIGRIMTLGTKMDWSPDTAAGMNRMFDPEKIRAKVPQFADLLAKAHTPLDWESVCVNTAAFLQDLVNGQGLPAAAFAQIACPAAIGWGELDNVVTREESRDAAETLPNGRLEIFQGFKHPIEQVDFVLLAERLREFFR